MFFAVTTLIAALVALPQTGPSQPLEPWFGTWRLNLEKSTADRDVRYKRATSRIEPRAGGLRVTYDLVGVRGGLTHMEWIGKFDGKDYPVQGVDYVLTNAYSRVNERSYQIVTKVDGALTTTATVVISPDNKTLTTVTTGKDAKGNTLTTTTVYERQ
jgi:hypothetical protein